MPSSRISHVQMVRNHISMYLGIYNERSNWRELIRIANYPSHPVVLLFRSFFVFLTVRADRKSLEPEIFVVLLCRSLLVSSKLSKTTVSFRAFRFSNFPVSPSFSEGPGVDRLNPGARFSLDSAERNRTCRTADAEPQAAVVSYKSPYTYIENSDVSWYHTNFVTPIAIHSQQHKTN